MKKCLTIIMTILSSIVFAQTQHEYTGKIGHKKIYMTIIEPSVNNNRITGYYSSIKDNKKIEFRGEYGVFSGLITLNEKPHGESTGYFWFLDGIDYSKAKLTASWNTLDQNNFQFVKLKKK